MVEVKYLGRLGNKLFQYCFARILAEGLGYRLTAKPIPGFPNTTQPVEGRDYSSGYPVQVVAHDYPRYYPGDYRKALSWKNGNLDIKQLLGDRSERKIEVRGYFERYEYYRPYKEVIRDSWLKPEASAQDHGGPDDVAVHIRLGDAGNYLGRKLPLSYYHEALEQAGADRVFICTDAPSDPRLKKFARYRPFIRQADPLQDFLFMMSCGKIILSQSTFSWWAAFLSRAREIYFPLPLLGVWSPFHPETDLRVDDESRYVFIKCRSIAMPSWEGLISTARRESEKITS